MNAGNGGGEAFPRGRHVNRTRQPGDDVAAVGNVNGFAQLGALVQFVELPLGGIAI